MRRSERRKELLQHRMKNAVRLSGRRVNGNSRKEDALDLGEKFFGRDLLLRAQRNTFLQREQTQKSGKHQLRGNGRIKCSLGFSLFQDSSNLSGELVQAILHLPFLFDQYVADIRIVRDQLKQLSTQARLRLIDRAQNMLQLGTSGRPRSSSLLNSLLEHSQLPFDQG